MPVCTSSTETVEKHPDAPVLINFASVRSVHITTIEALKCPSLSTMTIIADSVPEQRIKDIIQKAEKKKSESLVLRQ